MKTIAEILSGGHCLPGSARGTEQTGGHASLPASETPSVWEQDMETCAPHRGVTGGRSLGQEDTFTGGFHVVILCKHSIRPAISLPP